MTADVTALPATAEAAPAEGAKPPRGSKKKALLIGLLVMVVVAVQAALTYLLLPSGHAAAESDEHAEEHAAEADGHGGPAPKESHDSHGAHGGHGAEASHTTSVTDDTDMAEVPIGDFGSSNGTAAPGSIMHVDFKLSAVTAGNQAAALEAQLKSRQARVRQIVNRIVRSSNLEELNDPNLATIKRQIREEINRLMRKSYIIEIVVTDVRIMEQ
jgi:flagellar basal body-associated protein FliL